MNIRKSFKKSVLSMCIASLSVCASLSIAQEEDTVELENFIAEEEVQDDLGLLPTEPVESVFGFGKTLLETPRSVSSISTETLARYAISDIDDLVVLSPGAFTQSFFGVAGALDVRGTPGEVYFRGVRRLDNPGNYPTPIGASDRIDIVRGPATPIMGPSKIGGYLNFVPKSARAETGQYLQEPTGETRYITGSWDKSVLSSEVGGPGSLFGKDMGYYVYFELEDSGSYYENTSTEQNITQASFNMDLNSSSRIEFGGMYHDYKGNQVAGWNRLTQDLIDNGTYITGSPLALDRDGDGSISHQEFGLAYDTLGLDFETSGPGGGPNSNFGVGLDGMDAFAFWTSVAPAGITDEDIPSAYALQNPGTTQLDGSQVLVAPDDTLENEVLTLYGDYIFEPSESFSITNKVFYEAYENLNENAYGFSQTHDSYVFEDQLIIEFNKEFDGLMAGFQFSPSYRYTDFEHGSDYSNEFFDRRDLTGPSTALDRRLLATRIDRDYTEYYEGNYTNIGLAALADLSFDFGLSVLLGVRQDFIDVESSSPVDKLLCPIIDDNGNYLSLSANFFGIGCSDVITEAEDDTDGTSWTASVSYTTPFGLTPYFTASEQYTIIAGQGAEISTDNIASGAYFDVSELLEFGIKGSLVDGRLYFALSHYEQTRTDSNAQAIVTNQTAETTGTEFEIRYLVTDKLTFTAGYTNIEVLNLNTEANGGRFSFFGADDMPLLSDPSLIYGGQIIGVVPNAADKGAYKAGIPEDSYSASVTYAFDNGITTFLSYFHADETPSGHSRAVILPSYDLFNAGVSYTADVWTVSLVGKNITDETYFRANFPDLFGTQIVLPEKPFNWEATLTYKF